MYMNEYQKLARRTQNEVLTREQRMLHALHGLASEVGEIHAIFQKVYQGHQRSNADVLEELGDVLWFAAELCDAMEVELGDVAIKNIDKLRHRYPEGFSPDLSLHRAN